MIGVFLSASGILFFLKIKETYELTAINVSGVSNVCVIVIPSILSVLIVVFLITAINPITSILVKKYEIKKGAYEVDQEYLGAITENGIWVIRQKQCPMGRVLIPRLGTWAAVSITIPTFSIGTAPIAMTFGKMEPKSGAMANIFRI